MRTRLKDVAEALKLSVSTVNAALQNRPDISQKTRERVLRKARELGYLPNRVARSLVTQRTQVIGVVVPDLSRSFFTEVVTGIDEAASAAGYHLLLCNTREDPSREDSEIQTLIGSQVDGLIIASAHAPSENEVWRELRRTGVPFVLVDRFFRDTHFVGGDDEQIGFIATKHLIQQGYERIAHIRGPNVMTAIGRLKGYTQALHSRSTIPRRDWRIGSCLQIAESP
jgi:LacI family transcriptional regulator